MSSQLRNFGRMDEDTKDLISFQSLNDLWVTDAINPQSPKTKIEKRFDFICISFILPKIHSWVEHSYDTLWVNIMHHVQNPKSNMGDNLSYTLKDDEICNPLPKGLSIFIIKYAQPMNI